MAWTRKKPSGKFEGRYRNAEGKVRSAGTFTQPKQALREAQRVEAEQREPTALDLDGGKISWQAWFEQWHQSQIVRYSTHTQYISIAKNHITPRWGETALKSITHFGVSKWVADMHREGKSSYLIDQALQIFRASLNAAIDANRISVNPTRKVKAPPRPKGTDRYLTMDEVEAITTYMGATDALIVWFSVLTGLRFGELAGLHWQNVNFENRTIRVLEQFDQKELVINPPKYNSVRTVTMIPWLRDELHKLYDAQPTHAKTCGVPHHNTGNCRSDLVFRGKQGRPRKSNAWGAGDGPWQKAKDLAGITDRVRVHDMRHTYGSWLKQQGMSNEKIGERMGHTDGEMAKRYGHLNPVDDNEEATVALETYMARQQARRGGDDTDHSGWLQVADSSDHDGEVAG